THGRIPLSLFDYKQLIQTAMKTAQKRSFFSKCHICRFCDKKSMQFLVIANSRSAVRPCHDIKKALAWVK
ncbi:MAG: hypothetical protein NTW16_05020, partial [Bacteroidetes bacterium]|nr:hypothetical protein [Bacteroidota bacterium]